MWETILTWLATTALNWLLGIISKKVQEHEAQVELDKARQAVNDENVKKYENAKDRSDRISAALDILNRA